MANPRPTSAVVLLSAGLDSAFNLAVSVSRMERVVALTFNYGQRAASSEVTAAGRLATHFGVLHHVFDLPWFSEFAQGGLVRRDLSVPTGPEVEIASPDRSHETAKMVWVPNRNGIFLNIAAGFAEGMGLEAVVPGFNAEEAATFPDNTGDFLNSLDDCFRYSTLGRVRTHCESKDLDKAAIVGRAKDIGLPFSLLWPCYFDGPTWCGECESCQRFRRALLANGLSFEELARPA